MIHLSSVVKHNSNNTSVASNIDDLDQSVYAKQAARTFLCSFPLYAVELYLMILVYPPTIIRFYSGKNWWNHLKLL